MLHVDRILNSSLTAAATFNHKHPQHKRVLCPREDDDINDVTSMAGVNLREENAQILTSTVGAVVQSCQDQLFLSTQPVLSRILHTGAGSTLRHKLLLSRVYYRHRLRQVFMRLPGCDVILSCTLC